MSGKRRTAQRDRKRMGWRYKLRADLPHLLEPTLPQSTPSNVDLPPVIGLPKEAS